VPCVRATRRMEVASSSTAHGDDRWCGRVGEHSGGGAEHERSSQADTGKRDGARGHGHGGDPTSSLSLEVPGQYASADAVHTAQRWAGEQSDDRCVRCRTLKRCTEREREKRKEEDEGNLDQKF
jgi:hypothetical protein